LLQGELLASHICAHTYSMENTYREHTL